MFCSNCGKNVGEDKENLFCPDCGSKIDWVAKFEEKPEQPVEAEKKAESEKPVEGEKKVEPEKLADAEQMAETGAQQAMPGQPVMPDQPIMPGQPAADFQQNGYMQYNGMSGNAYMPQYQGAPVKKAKKVNKVLIISLGIVGALIIAAIISFVALGGVHGIQARSHISTGNRYLQEEDYELAIAAFEEAISIDPSLPASYIGLADAYIGLDDYDKAIEVLEDAIDDLGGNRKLEEYLDEVIEMRRIARIGFEGHVYKVDTDLDDTNNEALEGVSIKLSGDAKESVESDEDGAYHFWHLTPGEYTLEFSYDGFITYETTIEIEEETYQLDIFLEPDSYAVMYGNISIADADMDFTNNRAFTNAEVSLVKLTGSSELSMTASTDNNGQYEFDDLVMGVYEVTVEESGYIQSSQIAYVYEGQNTCYNIVLEVIDERWEGEGSASGTVYDAVYGNGVEGLTLNIREGMGNTVGDIITTVKTDDYGMYNVSDLPAGNYCAEIVDERLVEEKYMGSIINIKILGGEHIGNQDGTVSTTMMDGQVRIVLSWGASPRDLDSHLQCDFADGYSSRVYYSNMAAYSNSGDYGYVAALDLDDIESYGPETITIYNDEPGIYTYGVYKFSSEGSLANSGATVQVYMNNNPVPTYMFSVPSGSGDFWEVFTYNSVTGTLSPVNTMYDYYGEGSNW